MSDCDADADAIALVEYDHASLLLARGGSTADASGVLLARARVVADMASPQAAVSLVREALAAARRGNVAHKIASALTALSEVLAAIGSAEAGEVVRQALELSDQCGYQPLRDRAATILHGPNRPIGIE